MLYLNINSCAIRYMWDFKCEGLQLWVDSPFSPPKWSCSKNCSTFVIRLPRHAASKKIDQNHNCHTSSTHQCPARYCWHTVCSTVFTLYQLGCNPSGTWHVLNFLPAGLFRHCPRGWEKTASSYSFLSARMPTVSVRKDALFRRLG